MTKSVFGIKLLKNIIHLLAIFVFCICTSVMAADVNKFSSINIEESLLLGQDMKTIETKFGKAKFVKGLSRSYEKIISRDDWDKFAWENYGAGHYLYRFKRADNEVQYAIIYGADSSKSKFHPIERAVRIWITFDKSPTFIELTTLIPEIKAFDNSSIRVFIKNPTSSDQTELLYIANSSNAASLIATGWEKESYDAGFSIEIVLEEKILAPSESSKVKKLVMDVSTLNAIGYDDYKPYRFIALSKQTEFEKKKSEEDISKENAEWEALREKREEEQWKEMGGEGDSPIKRLKDKYDKLAEKNKKK